jgi:hypothetical protein
VVGLTAWAVVSGVEEELDCASEATFIPEAAITAFAFSFPSRIASLAGAPSFSSPELVCAEFVDSFPSALVGLGSWDMDARGGELAIMGDAIIGKKEPLL